MRVHEDRGDIVLGWLTKLAIVLGVLGLLGFDAISLAQAHFQAADRASTAAQAAAEEYRSSHDVQRAFNAAYATVSGDDSIESTTFRVGADGLVRLRLHHVATTLVLRHIGPLKHWAVAVETGEGRPPS
ncbi:MAG: hypothetical protein QOJ79_1185 [Actinomycetota bacterium]|jgi:hypothetical protein|nr:hypothetical protein [Actinomycetota bacterium]